MEKIITELFNGKAYHVRESIVDMIMKVEEGSMDHFRFFEIIMDLENNKESPLTTEESAWIDIIMSENL